MLENLKILRKQRGVSQQKLADAIDVSQQSINKYENHNVEPDIMTLMKLADYFGVSVDTVIGHVAAEDGSALSDNKLSADESDFLRNFRLLSPSQRRCVSVMMSELIAK